MKKALGALLVLPALAFAGEGIVPEGELSLGGVAIGDTPRTVIARLGKPARKVEESGYLDLHYDYPNLRVSFSEGVAAGLHSARSGGCTPKRLCPEDSFNKMRALYGPPLIADRETGRFYEYYAMDAACWLQIPARDEKIASITVACQP
ncbi:hypothetical protein K4L06_14655 [Lysobacter sp. BMK333-48F3]|uniref:hypothetical protein n=1 Tax=Lysobacter sp. BMK333-48F3 TaxID=2867962 RepID=UPI001C8C148B|nr:hypothetical protein [Lysobacter sp. BMK333-48F3]MBX9402548.1 hypothetical protein [Lysobacter sp. BMK333-48F3]